MLFAGFPPGTARFLARLSRNNDKTWFESHRADYDTEFLEPAKAFVDALAPRLKKLDPSVQAVPKVNGSIMRINRDIRFARDKSPYKDHLDLWFWSGKTKDWDTTGFFFRLTPKRLMLGAGMHHFSAPALTRYRKAVSDDKKGQALARIVGALREAGYDVGGETYKKPPRGFHGDHPRAALLRHGGLHAGWEGNHPKQLTTPSLVDFVASHYAAVLPLHTWLRGLGR